MLKSILISLSSLAIIGIAQADTAVRFAEHAVGAWTSAEQSSDPGYDWVESEMVRIWPDREDGVWLYQENAILGASPDDPDRDDAAKEKPYFQVVIHIRDLGGNQVHTATYRVADRAAAKGAWRTPDAFEPAWLGEVSCMGEMEEVGAGYWRGGTECPNSFRGAVRVVSKSIRSPGAYVNWDRGLDADGNVVWGPPDGGYIFKRKEDAQ